MLNAALPSPKEGIYRLNDYKGLYLEIKPNGIKAWRYRFKLNDKASWYALGDYPSVTLGEAREKCDAARKLVREGINPVRHRQSSASNESRILPIHSRPSRRSGWQ